MSIEMGQVPIKNLHEIRQQLVEKYPLIKIPERSYLVLMSPRSGSTLLCAHLENIGFGRPTEGFHFSKRALTERFGNEIDFSDPYAHTVAVLNYGTANGVFGLKFSWVEFELFLKKARTLIGQDAQELTDNEILDIFFPDAKFVRLIRKNKVKQAVSYAKAMQTGVWREHVGESEDYKNYIVPPEYNRDHIEALFDNLLAYDLSWEYFLRNNHKECLDVWYEDLAKDYVNVMTKVCDYLGVKNDEALEPPLKRQSDQVSAQWTQRFLTETAWLQDPYIKQGLETGDFNSIFFYRNMQTARKHERQVWAGIPYHKNKAVKRLIYRLKLRLGSQEEQN